ncbi:MAG: ATP-binding protein [Pseudomonadota bacterium]|nr:ATP-binding protein [Pseudomonadota bacterium]
MSPRQHQLAFSASAALALGLYIIKTMIIKSFAKQGQKFLPIEVEVKLVPGLPSIQIVGLPDTTIKESAVRIRSAIKNCHYRFPRAQTIVVNLHPVGIKKSGTGLDLAIAFAYLIESGQVDWPPSFSKECFFYGALDLSGNIISPDELSQGLVDSEKTVVTGVNKCNYQFESIRLKSLADISGGEERLADSPFKDFARPHLPKLKFSSIQARLLSVISLGEHPCLLAGPSGQGKTTMAQEIINILRRPGSEELKEFSKVWRQFGSIPSWRPMVSPHHTIPTISMIGGGCPIRPGEITRAHGGVLLMDEFFEFNQKVFESLREPVEKGELQIARMGLSETFAAKVLLVATSNLCPCGEFVPIRGHKCRCSNRRRETYFERFRGPMLDRFAIFSMSSEWSSNKEVALIDILSGIEKAQEFIRQSRQQTETNHWASDLIDISQPLEKFLPYLGSSRRRRKYLFQVARSVADLEGSENIKLPHIEEAAEYCLFSHQRLTSQLSLY